MLLRFEIIATVAGLTEGILLMLNKRIGWLVYIIEIIFTLLFAYFSKLYGDVLNNCIYLVMGITSCIIWTPKIVGKISKCNSIGILSYIMVSIVGSLILYLVLKNTGDPLPLIDAVSTCTSFVATYLMMTRKIDAWYVWLFNDIVYCIEYMFLPNKAFYLFALNVIWTVLAIISLINWKSIMRGTKNEKSIFCGKI